MSLNCESTFVKVMDRGGQTAIFDIPSFTSLKYSRVRDDMSSANLVVQRGDVDATCWGHLGALEAGRHELLIVRNGVRVWEGPVSRAGGDSTTFEIEARDVFLYVYRTILQNDYNNAYPNTDFVTERARTLLEGELVRWEAAGANILAYLDIRTDLDTAHTSRNTLQFEKTLFEEIDDMAARSGMDYTCVGRSIVVNDTHYALGRTVPLTDDDFDGQLVVTQYGMNLCTYAAVTDGLGHWSARKIEEDYYGPWEMLETSYSVQDTIQCAAEGADTFAYGEMGEQAVRNLSNRYPSPVTVRVPDNSRLNPDTGLTINDLVPGVRIPLVAVRSARTVSQEQKLDKVTFELTGGDEVITVVMSPSPGTPGTDPETPQDSQGQLPQGQTHPHPATVQGRTTIPRPPH